MILFKELGVGFWGVGLGDGILEKEIENGK